jgi:hypothetical protein
VRRARIQGHDETDRSESNSHSTCRSNRRDHSRTCQVDWQVAMIDAERSRGSTANQFNLPVRNFAQAAPLPRLGLHPFVQRAPQGSSWPSSWA